MSEGKINTYFSPTKGELSLTNVMAEIAEFVAERPDLTYTLAIGSDSQVRNWNGSSSTNFVTAIVIHGKGRGGRVFYHKTRSKEKYVLQTRIWEEAMMSLDAAHILVEGFSQMLENLAVNLEIHIDVGKKGRTNSMVTEVIGAVRGNGFEPVIKPFSYASSSVADSYT